MGRCPCPRCLIPKDSTHLFGTKQDRNKREALVRVDNLSRRAKVESARQLIYEQNWAVDSKPIQRLLQPESLVPTEVSRISYYSVQVGNVLLQNAFSHQLSQFGFNLFSIFLVDFMHEIELGVWRSLFIHLLRILECGTGSINKLDWRFVLFATMFCLFDELP
jgi:hypothetical protein